MEGIYTGYAEVLLMIIPPIFRLEPQEYQDTTEQSRKTAALSTKAEKSHGGMHILLKKKKERSYKSYFLIIVFVIFDCLWCTGNSAVSPAKPSDACHSVHAAYP